MKILGPDGNPYLNGHAKNGSTKMSFAASPSEVLPPPPEVSRVQGFFDDLENTLDEFALKRHGHVFKAPTRARKDVFGDIIAELTVAAEGTRSEESEQRLKMYASALWVYDAVYAIATNMAQVPLVAVRDGEDQPDSPLQGLLNDPGEGMLTQDELIEQTVTYLELVGTEMVHAERVGRDPGDPNGEIIGFRPLRPSRMTIHPGFGPFGIEKFVHSISGRDTTIHPLNIVFLRLFNPNDDYWGQSPLSVLARSIDIDRHGETWNQSLVEQGGHPDVVAEAKDHVSRRTKRQLRHDYEQRFQGKGSGLLILDEGLVLKTAGFSPKDMEFMALMRAAMHRIISAYGVPPIVMMDLRDASVLANADTQRELFWEQTLFPLGRRLENGFTRIINTDPRFPPEQGWRVRFAYEQVESLRKSDTAREKQAMEHYNAGGLTRNEYRERIGEQPIDGGDEFKSSSPGGIVSLGVNGDKVEIGMPRVLVTAEQKRLGRRAYQNLTRLHLGKMSPVLAKFFRDQSARVRAAFRDHLNLGSKAHIPDGDFADEAMLSAIFDFDAETKLLLDRAGPIYLSAFLDSANAKMEDILAGRVDFELLGEEADRVRDAIEKWGATRVKDITKETQRALRDVLAAGFEDGATPTELQKRIKGLFDLYVTGSKATSDSRAERIARTEMGSALNEGAFAAAREAEAGGVRLLKSWLSARDDSVRFSHRQLDEMTSKNPIALGQPFDNGLMYPNEVGGAASEVINCRCSMLEIVAEE